MMVEEISIFQNKMTQNFPNKVLEQVRSKVGAMGVSGEANFDVAGGIGESAS